MSACTYSVAIDSREVTPFIAKMERLLAGVREVFGDGASVDVELDVDLLGGDRGELVVRPFCKSLQVTAP